MSTATDVATEACIRYDTHPGHPHQAQTDWPIYLGRTELRWCPGRVRCERCGDGVERPYCRWGTAADRVDGREVTHVGWHCLDCVNTLEAIAAAEFGVNVSEEWQARWQARWSREPRKSRRDGEKAADEEPVGEPT